MRDILVTLLIFGSLPLILYRPYYGILVWSWLSYMNPHRLGWGFAYDMPFAKIVAITLLLALLLRPEKKSIPVTGLTTIWWVYIAWMIITTLNAIYFEDAMYQMEKIIKIQLVVFLGLMVINDKERLNQLVWVIYLSLGFFGIKGGVFTIATGGGHRVWGPAESFIADNNHLATALLMVIPLGVYLYQQYHENKWLRFGLIGSMGLITISVVGSYSRGAFLAIICVALFLWWKSQRKLIIGLLVLPLLPVLFLAMPEQWHERMESISNYEEDASALGRLNAWTYSVNAANARITGAGLDSWSGPTFDRWAPNPEDVHAAHSIYFGVLADHGWIGLLLFLSILLGAWLLAGKLINQTRGSVENKWMTDLARMIQVSLVAYGSGGAFLSLAYFDLPWHLVSILVIMQQILRQQDVTEAVNPALEKGWYSKPQRPS